MATNRAMLKEAIADAKAVKETAIANAKAALEEAFTPQLKSMLSMKLQEMDLEEDNFEEAYMSEEDENSETYEKGTMEEVDLEELLAELEENELEEGLYEAEETEEEEISDEEEIEDEGEPIDLEDMTDEDLKSMIEDVIADMIKSGELEAGHEGEEEEMDMDMDMEMEPEDEEDVDLAELLREIEEMEGGYGLEEDSIPEGKIPSKEEFLKKLEKFSQENPDKAITKNDLTGEKLEEESLNEETLKEKIARFAQYIGLSASAVGTIFFIAGVIKDSGLAKAAKMAETVDMNILAQIGGYSILMGLATAAYGYLNKKMDGMEESMSNELEEAYSTIKTLKSELNEINLLNAKLLYTNKIFKSKTLNENQKVKVLSSFDKAKNVGEVKMVFETLNEGIKVSKNTINENLGRASKGTMAPNVKKPIVESNEAFLRMQKLAGII